MIVDAVSQEQSYVMLASRAPEIGQSYEQSFREMSFVHTHILLYH
jgi:hypothetical protein